VVLSGEGDYLAVGHAVTVAAGLEQAGAPGEILLGEETVRLVRDAVHVEPLEPFPLKGKPEPVRAFGLLSVDPLAPGVRRHFERPLVDRERDLGLLRTAWQRTIEGPNCQLFTLLGTAGVGKSRLVSELFVSVSEQAHVLSGRCLPYGAGITFWPLVEALMEVGQPAAAMLERLQRGGVAIPSELFWEVRRLLESLASQRPIILHIDDLQWAEPTLFDLLDHIVELSRGVPMLVLCTARPELLEDRPGWGGGKLNATTVLLEPLDLADSEMLLEHLGDGLDRESRMQVIAASEGNPLFLEEMVALAREQGTVAVPATIRAVLVARLERLHGDEREVLERGAVEGEVFHRQAVRALGGKRLDAALDLQLAGLVRKELIRPHPPTFRGDEAFRFRHLLIRDAAYDGLPKATRAELHERFATWLARVDGDIAEREEIAGWHLEQAVRYKREVGHTPNVELARRAADHLHEAGRRASARSDVAAARNLLERAFVVVPDDDSSRSQIAVDLAERLTDAGEFARADEILTGVEHEPEVAAHAALVRIEWLHNVRPRESIGMIRDRIPGLLEQLAAAGDERGVARAHFVAFQGFWFAVQATSASAEARLAADHARAAGDEGLRSRALAWYIAALMDGPFPPSVIEAELDELARDGPSLLVRAWLDIGRGVVRRLEGEFDEARRLMRGALASLGEFGLTVEGASSHMEIARIERAAGNLSAALELLQRCDELLAGFGESSFRSTTQADLADVYELLGDREAAARAIELSDELGAAEDLINSIVTDRVRARLALAEGDRVAAERWARRAAEAASVTDFPEERGDAFLDLARVLSAVGRDDEAVLEARRALAEYEAKGDRPSGGRARALLEQLAKS
jgi:tetratricopeptide (TPR) repeat protein